MSPRLGLGVALLLLAGLALAGAAPVATAQTAVTGVITGPSALAPGGNSTYHLNATGGPGASTNGNFTIKYFLRAPDLTGGLPQESSPGSQTNATGTFKMNVTAPQAEETVVLVVIVNSTSAGISETATLTYSITVVTPIVLTATFTNSGHAAALNVTVKFYVDGTLVGTTNVGRIEPGASATATLSFLPVGLGVGTHQVVAKADLNKNGIIEPDKGEVAVSDVFYKEGAQLTWGWAIVIIILAVFVTLLVIQRLRARQQRK